MQQSPYLNDRVFEAFDALLVAAAFEQEVSLLFTGPGVQQLIKDQAPLGQRSLSKILNSLATYEVTHIYADADAMSAHNLAPDDCELSPTLLTGAGIADLINSQDVVLNG